MSIFRKIQIVVISVTATLLSSTAANAEVLPIRWGEPARAAEVAARRNVAIGFFSGSDGPELAANFEAFLAEARGQGAEQYYALYPLSGNYLANEIEVLFEGHSTASIEERRTQQLRKYCSASENLTTNCKDSEKGEREVTCRTRTVSLASEVRALAMPDRRLIYVRSFPQQNSWQWCPTEDAPPASEVIVASMIDAASAAFSSDMVPAWRSGSVRLLESTKGLSREQGQRFKMGLRATKSDANEACRIFDDLAAQGATQRSVSFNSALCTEMRGDLIAALRQFEAIGGYSGARFAALRIRGTLQALSIEEERWSKRN